MKRIFILLLFLFFATYFSQKTISGKVVNIAGFPVANVMVVNIVSGNKTVTDAYGSFQISATVGEELRFVGEHYERSSHKISEENFQIPIKIQLQKLPFQIQEVEVGFKPTGDLNKDSKALAKTDKKEVLEKEIGLPKPKGKPREKPAEVKQVVLPVLLGQLNVQGVYDLVSGKARKQKRLYKYEDMQDNISWIRGRLGNEYFIEAGIPEEKIQEFITFSLMIKPEIASYIKANNLSKVSLKLEETMPVYLEKLKS